jgi:cardiolipin synthase
MSLHYIPNIITLLRLILVIPTVACLLSGDYILAFWAFFIAGSSDALDGYLARRYNWFSRFGSILDPIADKSLMFCVFLTLGYLNVVPMWIALLVVSRDLVIVAGAAAYYFSFGKYTMQPSLISKLNTLVQITFALGIMLSLSYLNIQQGLLDSLMYLMVVTTVISGIDYVLVWGRRAWQAYGETRNGVS